MQAVRWFLSWEEQERRQERLGLSKISRENAIIDPSKPKNGGRLGVNL
jgi:hypothetical protein